MKVRCSNCRKKFDYENFYGLCPKCGAYNAKPVEEAHEDLHRFYGETDESVRQHMDSYGREEGRARSSGLARLKEASAMERNSGTEHTDIGAIVVKIMTFAAVCVILICLMGIFSLAAKKNSVPETADVEVVRASAGDVLSYGDYQYSVTDAVVVADAGEDRRLPERTKLLAVYLMMAYEGKNGVYRDRFMPYLYDGKNYTGASESFDLAQLAEEYGLPGENLDSYSVYSGTPRATDGYILYLVDENCGEITVNLECRKDTYLERVYEVRLVPYGWMEEEDGGSWDGWDGWYDYDPFYGFDDYFNWFDDYDDYDDYGSEDDYEINDMMFRKKDAGDCGL